MLKKRLAAILVIAACVVAWQALRRQRIRSQVDSEFEAVGSEVGALGLPRRVRHGATGIVMVLIPSGSLTMGTPESEPERDASDEAQYEATIDSAFYLAETEVTVAQWKRLMGAELEGAQADDDMPMTGVTWHKAKEFVNRMNEEGEGGWRLPSEAEWEYACRAGTTTPFSFGDGITTDQANYDGQRPYAAGEPGLDREGPVPVRSFPPNPWGLYEMHGNVWEWCEDLYVAHPERRQRPKNLAGEPRVIRGGGWPSRGKQLRSGYRDGYPPNSSGEKYGVRLAKSLSP